MCYYFSRAARMEIYLRSWINVRSSVQSGTEMVEVSDGVFLNKSASLCGCLLFFRF